MKVANLGFTTSVEIGGKWWGFYMRAANIYRVCELASVCFPCFAMYCDQARQFCRDKMLFLAVVVHGYNSF